MNFAWYLAQWLTVFHGDERSFWKTMNPARFGALYRALLGPGRAQKEEKKSLSQYLMGG